MYSDLTLKIAFVFRLTSILTITTKTASQVTYKARRSKEPTSTTLWDSATRYTEDTTSIIPLTKIWRASFEQKFLGTS